jgi:hypothetical protein
LAVGPAMEAALEAAFSRGSTGVRSRDIKRQEQRLVAPARATLPQSLLSYLAVQDPSNEEDGNEEDGNEEDDNRENGDDGDEWTETGYEVNFDLVEFFKWLVGAAKWVVIDLLVTECDGPVAAFYAQFSARSLWDGTHTVPGWGKEMAHLGTDDTSAGCGARSLYSVGWHLRRVGA